MFQGISNPRYSAARVSKREPHQPPISRFPLAHARGTVTLISFALFHSLEIIDRLVRRSGDADQLPAFRAELIEVAFEREKFTGERGVLLFTHARIILIARGRKLGRFPCD